MLYFPIFFTFDTTPMSEFKKYYFILFFIIGILTFQKELTTQESTNAVKNRSMAQRYEKTEIKNKERYKERAGYKLLRNLFPLNSLSINCQIILIPLSNYSFSCSQGIAKG